MPEATEMQQMEMDMVQGMYDTYELLSSDPPRYSVLLSGSADDDLPELRVTVTYSSADYPDTAPCEVAVEHVGKLRRVPIAQLQKELTAMCAENVGMHCVVMALQHAHDVIARCASDEERASLQRRGEAMEAAAVAERAARMDGGGGSGSGGVAADPTIHIGTAVTRELFDEWSRRRAHELARVRSERERRDARPTASKLTGRQLWDSALRSTDWELFAAAAADVEDGGEDVDFDLAYDLGDDDDDDGDDDEGGGGDAARTRVRA